MTSHFDDDTKASIAKIAKQNGFGEEAGLALADALVRGGGTMAQFRHPELGGQGQWSGGGMLMIGDMFNDDLKARVGALAKALSEAVKDGRVKSGDAEHGSSPASPGGGGTHWWPETLGSPSSSGGQNDWRYAVFPDSSRLVVERDGTSTVYDTGDHRIHGVSQQQGSGSTLAFTSQKGTVRLDDLSVVEDGGETSGDGEGSHSSAKRQAEAASPAPTTMPLGRNDGDPVETIRRLAELRDRGILTEEEFGAKKRDLLARL